MTSRKTPHPCVGMTRAQRRDFELIAINRRPLGGHMTVEALLERGLIEKTEPIAETLFFVPLRYHMQWCQWASEQPQQDE